MHITSVNNKLKILLVEDSKGDALLIEKALNAALPASYTLEKSTTIENALNILTTNDFDIALLDRSLPDVEGFSGLHSIQNMAPSLPIIFLTAYKDEGTAFEAIEQGAQDYLFKDNIDSHIIKRAIQYAILRKQFEGVLIMRANFDPLTGLANRMLFESRLEMAIARIKRHGGNLAVLFIDLDRFKQVNDTLGHLAGDLLLKEVSERLKSALRPYDTAARFGGDEFAILLEGLPKIEHAETVAKKIVNLLSSPFQILGQAVEIGASIGISSYDIKNPIPKEELLKQADSAMYQAKMESGNNFMFYSGYADNIAIKAVR